jgi:hypothetical protein
MSGQCSHVTAALKRRGWISRNLCLPEQSRSSCCRSLSCCCTWYWHWVQVMRWTNAAPAWGWHAGLKDVVEQSSTWAVYRYSVPAVRKSAAVESTWIGVRPESCTIGFDHAVGFLADNVSLNCCEDSESKKNQESLHLCRLFAMRRATDCVVKFA